MNSEVSAAPKTETVIYQFEHRLDNEVLAIEQKAGVATFHLVKHLYQRSVEKEHVIRARLHESVYSPISGNWHHTSIQLCHERLADHPKYCVTIQECPDNEEIIVNLVDCDGEPSRKFHYFDISEMVNYIGFFLVKGRARQLSEALGAQLQHDLPTDLAD